MSESEQHQLRGKIEVARISVASAIRMVVAAAISFLLNLGITTALHQWLLFSEELSFLVALIVVSLINFFLSRHYVYQASEGSLSRQLIGFYTSIIGFRVTEYGAYLVLHTFLGVQYQLAVIVVLGLSFILKFVFFGLFVFREQRVR